MPTFAKVVGAVVLGMLASACGENGCGKPEKPKVCKTYGDAELMCPTGQKCIYKFGDDPQDPTKYGQCEDVEEYIECKYVTSCPNPNKECSFNASFCDATNSSIFCYCEGPHAGQEPTGGQSEAKK